MWVLFTHWARLLITEKSPSSFSAWATKRRASSAVGAAAGAATGSGAAAAEAVSTEVPAEEAVQEARQTARARAETWAFMTRTSSFLVWSPRLLRLPFWTVKRRGNRR